MEKIIFDLDNTLIMFDDSYFLDYAKVIGGTKEDGVTLYNIIGKYEMLYHIYDRIELVDFINCHMNTNYNYDLIDKINNIISHKWIKNIPEGLDETLNYLSCKYNLFVLTNWFTECQKERLDNAGILKYFKEVVGSDKCLSKPKCDGYFHIIGNTDLRNVLVIGDNPNTDIKGAMDVGVKSILCDYDDKYKKIKTKIKDIRSLKEML